MKKYLLLLVVAIILGSIHGMAWAQELRLVSTEYPPYMYMENGQAKGIYVDIVENIFNEMRINGKIELMPWKRAVNDAFSGKAEGLLACLYTPERDEKLWLTAEPLDTEKKVIIARKDSGIQADSIADLKDRKFALVRGYSYGKLDDYPELDLSVCNDDMQMLKMLDAGRVDLAAGDSVVLKYLIKTQELGDNFKTVLLISESKNYLGFSKAKLGPQGKVLAEKFSQKLQSLKAKGYIAKIKQEYF